MYTTDHAPLYTVLEVSRHGVTTATKIITHRNYLMSTKFPYHYQN